MYVWAFRECICFRAESWIYESAGGVYVLLWLLENGLHVSEGGGSMRAREKCMYVLAYSVCIVTFREWCTCICFRAGRRIY